jgi:hypothetical protein
LDLEDGICFDTTAGFVHRNWKQNLNHQFEAKIMVEEEKDEGKKIKKISSQPMTK